jgi:DNA-binding NarL/FixJ family response regulator
MGQGGDGHARLRELGLSERELEVLALVAAGRTNGQIAAELFISPKTASVHVTHILDKLGVANRVEAAMVAGRLGWDRPTGKPSTGTPVDHARELPLH